MVDGRWGYYCISQYHSKGVTRYIRGTRWGILTPGEFTNPQLFIFYSSSSWLHKLIMIEIGNIYIMLNTVCT